MYAGSLSLYVVGILVSGWAALTLTVGKRATSWATALACALLLGAAAVGFGTFYLALAGLRPGEGTLEIVTGAALVALVVQVARGRFRLPTGQLDAADTKPFAWADLLAVVPLALAVFALWVVWIQAMRIPMYEWDAWAVWLFKAKVLAAEPLRPKPYVFANASFNYSHPGYPLLWPTLAAESFGLTATRDDHAARFVQFVLYVGLALTIYAGLRWRLGRTPAAALAAMAVALPSMMHYAANGYADIVLAAFYAGMFYFVARWVQSLSKPDLVLAALFAAATAFSKSEGGMLAVIAALAIGLFGAWRAGWRRGGASLLIFAAITFLPLTPWYAYAWHGPRDPDDYAHRAAIGLAIHNLHRVPMILSSCWAEWRKWDHWGPLWPLLVTMAAVGWRGFRVPSILAGWFILLSQAMLYGFVYLITSWDLQALISVSLERLMVHMCPAVVLLIGWHWAVVGRRPGAPSANPAVMPASGATAVAG